MLLKNCCRMDVERQRRRKPARIAAALGKGNLKRGLQKILATLEQPVSPKRVAKKKGTQA